MITIGYGDIHANSAYEILFIIVFAILSTGMFGYILNKSTNIIKNYNR